MCCAEYFASLRQEMQPEGQEVTGYVEVTNTIIMYLAPIILFFFLYTFTIVTIFTTYRSLSHLLKASHAATRRTASKLRVRPLLLEACPGSMLPSSWTQCSLACMQPCVWRIAFA